MNLLLMIVLLTAIFTGHAEQGMEWREFFKSGHERVAEFKLKAFNQNNSAESFELTMYPEEVVILSTSKGPIYVFSVKYVFKTFGISFDELIDHRHGLLRYGDDATFSVIKLSMFDGHQGSDQSYQVRCNFQFPHSHVQLEFNLYFTSSHLLTKIQVFGINPVALLSLWPPNRNNQFTIHRNSAPTMISTKDDVVTILNGKSAPTTVSTKTYGAPSDPRTETVRFRPDIEPTRTLSEFNAKVLQHLMDGSSAHLRLQARHTEKIVHEDSSEGTTLSYIPPLTLDMFDVQLDSEVNMFSVGRVLFTETRMHLWDDCDFKEQLDLQVSQKTREDGYLEIRFMLINHHQKQLIGWTLYFENDTHDAPLEGLWVKKPRNGQKESIMYSKLNDNEFSITYVL